jgi:protein-L-isoaspartate(D-aspartate) O-methyltransferase
MSVKEGARLRRQLVDELAGRGLIQDERVERALLAVPGEIFVPEFAAQRGLEAVYRDEAIMTKHDARGVPVSSSSQPAIMASMLERLDLREGQRVLEIGAGTGYNSALLAEIVGPGGRVISVELDPELAERSGSVLRQAGYRVQVVVGDGHDGWAAEAPYDRIIVTASASEIPHAWLEQTVEDGRIEVPVRLHNSLFGQAIPTLERRGSELRSISVLCGGFMPLRENAADAVVRPPTLSAREILDTEESALFELMGDALFGLPRTARRRLLALALGEPRTRRLGLRAPTWPLLLYLVLTGPTERLVFSSRLQVGVIDRRGTSLALVGGIKKTVDRIVAYGARDSEHRLISLIKDWKARGRPTEDDLEIRVSYRNEHSKLRYLWKESASADLSSSRL